MAKPVGIGILFPRDSHKTIMDVTRSRYSGMVERLKRKGLPTLDFDLDAFRADVLGVLGGKEDGVVVCRYCRMYFGISYISMDHAQPLSRGGSTGLSNLDYPCKRCNDIKGSLTVDELLKLIEFLEKEIPLARLDVLSRLQKAVSLAAGARADMAIKHDLKRTGAWQAVQAARRAKKKAKENGLGKF